LWYNQPMDIPFKLNNLILVEGWLKGERVYYLYDPTDDMYLGDIDNTTLVHNTI
jgi:hypothetical protein